ncbi:hypothetical protein ABGI61_14425 [Rheinheimera sp. FR7-31]|uniref:hypothetical protein n=1 Tax=Rheinheimera fenheensis TaxID=3152295 RepID=UPI00325D47AA
MTRPIKNRQVLAVVDGAPTLAIPGKGNETARQGNHGAAVLMFELITASIAFLLAIFAWHSANKAIIRDNIAL